MALTQEQIANYLASKGLPLTPEGIRAGIAAYNRETGSNLGIGDVGAAYNMTPQQASTWMNGGNPLTFSGLFGDDAIVDRPVDGSFNVYTAPNYNNFGAMGGGQGDIFASPNDGAKQWTYDPATQTYTSPTGKRVSIADLGISDPTTATYALGQMASREGRNIDSWSAYPANTYADWTPELYRSQLEGDLQKVMDYDASKSGGGLNVLMNTLPWLAGAALVGGGIGGALAPYEAGAAAATGGEAAAGGLLASQAPAPVADAAMTPVEAAAAGSGAGGGGTYLGLKTALAGAGIPSATADGIVKSVQGGASAGWLTKTLTDLGLSSAAAGAISGALPALAGAALAGSSSGGAKQAGTTTQTSSQAPWEPMQPYLSDIANAARANYQQSRTMTPEQMAILGQARSIAAGQMNDPNMAGLRSMSADVFTGKSDQFKPVQSITAQQVDPFGFQSAGAPAISVGGAFNRMGGVNPTQAYQSLLSGNVTNPFLSNIANDNFTMATRNMMENVMPGIGSGAMAAGQYGGSRQGIAQGLAMSRLNQDVTAANNNMFGNAYQQARGNMLSAAGQLGNFGMGAETQNASNILNNNQFNSSLASGIAQNNANRTLTADTTNASNTLSGNNQRLGQMGAAVDWYNTSNNMQNTGIKNALDLANYGNTYQNDALKNYAGVVAPLGGMGGTGSSSTPYYTNPTNSLLGGALAGSQIFKNIFA